MKNPIYEKIENGKEDQNEIQKEIKQENNDVNVTNQNYGQNITCVHYPFDNLLSLAIYNPMINNLNSDINNPNLSLTKNPKNLEKDEAPEDDLDLFINSLTKDIINKTQKDYDDSLNNIGSNLSNALKDPMNEKYEIKDIKEITETLENSENNTTNLNNTTMLMTNSTFISGPSIRKRRSSKLVITPNIFLSDYQSIEQKDYENLSKIQLSSINIRDIDRPFSILLKSAHLKELLNSTPFERNLNSIFQFKIQLFLGSQPFGKVNVLEWRNSTKDLDHEFNKRNFF